MHALSDADAQIVYTHFLDSCFDLHCAYMSSYLVQLWNLHEDNLWAKRINLLINLIEKMLLLKSVNHERWGLKDLWVYTH